MFGENRVVPDHYGATAEAFDADTPVTLRTQMRPLGIIYQSDSFASISNSVKLPGFARADGSVYYAFPDRKIRVALNIENLFNRIYFLLPSTATTSVRVCRALCD